MDIYAENILDHYRNPRNFGRLKNPTLTVSEINFSCGDKEEIDLKIEDGIIKDIAFRGEGCAISRASASLLTEKLKGKSLKEIKKIGKNQILKLLGIELGPLRLKCALLPLNAIKKALS